MSRPIYPFPRPRRSPEQELRELNRRFRNVSQGIERDAESRWYKKNFRTILLFLLLASVTGWLLAAAPPQSISQGVRHVVAIVNCDTARAVGLAPARRGNPGYWSRNDGDGDGIACEPWEGRR